MMNRHRLLVALALGAVLTAGGPVSSGQPPALVMVEVAVERPAPSPGRRGSCPGRWSAT
jgi:hypothetical protein